jgi:NAD(P)-dependent dehydrogenase (short-subunit alcohol dehydrogenase family)
MAEIAEAGGSASVAAGRPESAADAADLVSAALKAAGRLDLLVSASGMNIVSPTVDMTNQDWQTVMDANVRGSWLIAQAAGRQMIEQGGGGKGSIARHERAR